MDYIEIIGAVTGLAYLYFEVKARPVMWILGILMPLFYVYIYFSNGLFANAGINVYYILASVYGLLVWTGVMGKKSGQEDGRTPPIKSFPMRWLWLLVVVTAVLTLLTALLLRQCDESTQPWMDGFTAAMNMVGMWMLAKKYYQEWIVWILVDPFTITMCAIAGMWPTAIMYVVYLVVSVYGYIKWKKEV